MNFKEVTLHYIKIIPVLFAFGILCSCENDVEEIASLTKKEKVPISTGKNVEFIYSEKSDVKILVQDKLVDISAEHGEKKYHVKVPIKYKVDENSAKALYKNGILELVFKLAEDEKPKGKKVEVE